MPCLPIYLLTIQNHYTYYRKSKLFSYIYIFETQLRTSIVMKQVLFVIIYSLLCLTTAKAQIKHEGDSISSSVYFTYKDIPQRDSLAQTLGIDKSIYDYSVQKLITYIPIVSEFPMYKDGEEDKFSFLFNDPHYSATEKKKVAAIILQGTDTEAKLINEIRFITLDKQYTPIPAGNFRPIFPGGYHAMIQYLNDHFPASIIDKNKDILTSHPYLIVCFIVEKNGTLGYIKIIDSCNNDLDRKAYALIKNMPKWIANPQSGSKPIFIAMQLIFNKERFR